MMTKPRHVLLPRLIAAAAALGLLLGCTSGSTTDNQRTTTLDQVVFPAEDFDKQLHQQGERQVQQCMASQGFDYTPTEFIEPQDFTLHQSDGAGEQWSYGVADTIRDPTTTPSDPNEAALVQLADTERIAWQQALNSDSGCRSTADDQLAVDYGVADFGDELARLDERLVNHPERIALDAAWANCLASNGYDFVSRDAITSYLVQQLGVRTALEGLATTPANPPDLPQTGAGVAPTVASDAAIDYVADLEIELADVDARCSDELNFDIRATELDTTIRTEFLAETED